ncbi:MAG: sulfatase [Rikenellaceae bacterium]
MRHFLLGAVAVAATACTTTKEAKQPNILLICIDDLRSDMGEFGSEVVISPTLDNIASQGRLFTHQYVQAPTSGASRAMMLTGIGATNKSHVNNFTFSNSLVGTQECEQPETFVHHLKRNGYHTVGMGKISHSDSGQTFKDGEIFPELPYSWDEFINNPNSPWPNRFDAMLHGYANGKIREKGVTPAFEFLDLPDSCYADGQLASLAVEQLKKLSKSSDDKPFFMAVGFYKPHLPFVAPKKYWDMYDGVDVPLAENIDTPQGVDNAFMHNSVECFSQYFHPEKGGAGVQLSEDYARDMRRAYFSAISFTDSQVGRVMETLQQTGLDENTIVIVWGDHGWHLGDQTIWGKHSVFERALNSVLMVNMPSGMQARGERCDELIAAVDIYPTICELAGVTPPAGLDGVSFVEQIKNPEIQGRDYVISYWTNQITIRDKKYRFSIFDNGKKRAYMLYDHENDPYETTNISAQNPELVEKFTTIAIENNRGFLPNL